jgi:methyl-accepting chemotaxis protein
MTKSRDIVNQSVDESNNAGNSLQKIQQSMAAINELNTQIASAAEEQTLVAEEINRNVVVINETANQTAVAGNQTASSSQELAKLAANLQSAVSRFKL